MTLQDELRKAEFFGSKPHETHTKNPIHHKDTFTDATLKSNDNNKDRRKLAYAGMSWSSTPSSAFGDKQGTSHSIRDAAYTDEIVNTIVCGFRHHSGAGNSLTNPLDGAKNARCREFNQNAEANNRLVQEIHHIHHAIGELSKYSKYYPLDSKARNFSTGSYNWAKRLQSLRDFISSKKQKTEVKPDGSTSTTPRMTPAQEAEAKRVKELAKKRIKYTDEYDAWIKKWHDKVFPALEKHKELLKKATEKDDYFAPDLMMIDYHKDFKDRKKLGRGQSFKGTWGSLVPDFFEKYIVKIPFPHGDHPKWVVDKPFKDIAAVKKVEEEYNKMLSFFAQFEADYKIFREQLNVKIKLQQEYYNTLDAAVKAGLSVKKPYTMTDKLSRESDNSLRLLIKIWKDEIEAKKKEEQKKKEKENPANVGNWFSYFRTKYHENLFNTAYTIEGAKKYWENLAKALKKSKEEVIKEFKGSIFSAEIYVSLRTFLVKDKKTGKYREPEKLYKDMYRPKFFKLVREARQMEKAGIPWKPIIFRNVFHDKVKWNFQSLFKSKAKIERDEKTTERMKKADIITTNITKIKDKHPNRKTSKDWRTKLMSLEEQLGLSFHTQNRHYIPNALMADEAYKKPSDRFSVLLGTWEYLPKYSGLMTAVYATKDKKQIKVVFKGTSRTSKTGFMKEVVMQDFFGIALGGYKLMEKLGLIGGKKSFTDTLKKIEKDNRKTKFYSMKNNEGNAHYSISGEGGYRLEFNNRLYDFLKVYADYPTSSFSFVGHSLGGKMAVMVAHTSYLFLKSVGKRNKPFNVSGFGTGGGGAEMISQINRSFSPVKTLLTSYVDGTGWTGALFGGKMAAAETILNMKEVYKRFNTPQGKLLKEGLSKEFVEQQRQAGTAWTEKTIPYKMYRVKGDLISMMKETGYMFFQKEVPQMYCSGDKKAGYIRGAKAGQKTAKTIIDAHSSLNFIPQIFWEERDKTNVCN